MNLTTRLRHRLDSGHPVRVALIGASKFGSMFLAQVPSIEGLEVAMIADLNPDRAREACRTVGWDEVRITRTRFSADGLEACHAGDIEVVIEATGHPEAGIRHALAAIEAAKHIVMVNVEADALAGPLLAVTARERGVVYSMAYGDQPALVAEMVDWARAAGFTVAAAGDPAHLVHGWADHREVKAILAAEPVFMTIPHDRESAGFHHRWQIGHLYPHADQEVPPFSSILPERAEVPPARRALPDASWTPPERCSSALHRKQA